MDVGPTHNFYTVPGRDLLLMDHAGLWLGTHDYHDLELVRPEYQQGQAL